jgi:hypothetical protein
MDTPMPRWTEGRRPANEKGKVPTIGKSPKKSSNDWKQPEMHIDLAHGKASITMTL